MPQTPFLENLNPRGYLEVIKTYLDGTEEIVFSDHNIITVGMGINLALLFGSEDPTTSILNHQIRYFQVGTSGLGYEASSITQLQSPLLASEYGNTALGLASHLNTDGSGGTIAQTFAVLDDESIIKVSRDSITFVLNLDTATANDEALSEIGLFATDPFGKESGGGGLKASLLCAYRYFGTITKSDAFSLTFRWTIEF